MSDVYADEPTPDIDEVFQADLPPLSTVPVRIDEPAGVWLLPNRRVRIGSDLASDTSWTRVVDASRKRSRGVLVGFGQPIRIRVSTSGQGGLWPADTPYEFFHTEAVYVLCATASETAEVSITEEFWAD
jgi:hypothetical protein